MLIHAAAALAVFSTVTAQADPDIALVDNLKYVDQLIGTDNGGNVFAGATLPYGMAKAVADVDGQNTGGFSTDGSNVTGFSHMHDSGTGGNPSLGNFPLMPMLCPEDELDNCNYMKEGRATPYDLSSVVATPGYFSLSLTNGISARMTVTQHAALYQFQFPASTSSNGTDLHPMMLLDLTDLWDSRQNATVSVDSNGRIMANGTFLPSFGSGYYESYVCADFQGGSVYDTGMYVNSRAGNQPKDLFVTRGINLFYLQAGSFARFDMPKNRTITARVGVSLVSSQQACQNAESEMPTWDFGAYRHAAQQAWRQKLSMITVQAGGVDDSYLTNFFSGVYRTMISPQDYTGENPKWKSSAPYWDSFYCIWDEFRAQLPLLTIVDPIALSSMLNGLLNIYEHVGWLPDCRMSLDKGFTQGGSNADNVFADAYVKNITGVNWNKAYAAVVNDAENEPLDWSNEGRGGLMSWKSLNYIPYLDYDYLGFGTNSRSLSRTLEYSYNDFNIAQIGQGIGKSNYKKYYQRAGNWQNLWKTDQTSQVNGSDSGFTGFFQPKYMNGTWGYLDPIECSPLDGFCSLTSNPQEVFEDSVWEYSFFVPHDMATLISLMGGNDTFVSRLNYLHTSGLTDIGNEPSFLTVYQYHYAGRPALSAYRAHTYVPSSFAPTTTGLPGNDDSGAMGAFIAFTMSGLFPVAGQDVYLIIPPFFQSVSFKSPITGKKATIRNVNFDGPKYKNIYVQSATLNGKKYTKNWIGHDFFLDGGVLELTLGVKESEWGTGQADVPPSLSTESQAGMKMF